ncbi:MAG: RNA polymerase sigma factor [Sphingomonadaceae bacterium]|nr:RNA polymerase sigma factor [Sphingomonadaceae bacterium]
MTAHSMDRDRQILSWIAREILPHERRVRSRLVRKWGDTLDIDDAIQEAYYRLARLETVDHIENPAGYFHRTAHAVAVDMLRRRGVINFASVNENEWLNVRDEEPLADQLLEAKQEFARVNGLLGRLSDTCRRAIEMRRVEGLSQRETAERLGVSESVVRNHLVRGVQKILHALTEADEAKSVGEQDHLGTKVEYFGKRRSH